MVISGAGDSSAEIMVKSSWSYIATLHSKAGGRHAGLYFSGATLNNAVSVFGKYFFPFSH